VEQCLSRTRSLSCVLKIPRNLDRNRVVLASLIEVRFVTNGGMREEEVLGCISPSGRGASWGWKSQIGGSRSTGTSWLPQASPTDDAALDQLFRYSGIMDGTPTMRSIVTFDCEMLKKGEAAEVPGVEPEHKD